MLETFRRYWIGMLVLVMIGLHASIVGLIRYQASLAKVDASCEVDLGRYLGFQASGSAPISLRLHAIVPINHRMKSRQLIELNQAQIRQSLEEHLRQIDSNSLKDPYLSDLKSQLLEILVQTIGNSSVDDLVITEMAEAKDVNNLQFIARGARTEPRQLVATLRGQQESDPHDDEAVHDEDEEESEHGDDHGDDSKHEAAPAKDSAHAKPAAHGAKDSSKGHGAPAKGHAAPAKGHAAPAKGHAAPAKGHAAPAKGHGAEKKPAKKSSGH